MSSETRSYFREAKPDATSWENYRLHWRCNYLILSHHVAHLQVTSTLYLLCSEVFGMC